MQSPCAQPQPEAIVDKYLHPTRPAAGKEIRVMRLRLTEHAHHPSKCGIGPSAHVERLDCEPGRVDPDHGISSRSHAAHASATLVGHSIVIRELPLRIRTRIARSVNDGDGGELNRTWSVSATGKNPGEGLSRRVGRTASTLFGSATRD